MYSNLDHQSCVSQFKIHILIWSIKHGQESLPTRTIDALRENIQFTKRVKIIKKNVDLLKKALKLFRGLGNYFSSQPKYLYYPRSYEEKTEYCS